MRIKSLDQLPDWDLSQLVSGSPMSLLVGSGISIWEPTNLPSGQQVSGEIFEAIFGDAEREWGTAMACKLREHYNDLPFERIMERCQDRNALHQVLRLIFNTTTHNPLHQLLAKLLVEGKVESIVTTNYDCCLDEALLSYAGWNSWELMPEISRIVEPTPQFAETRRVYFKIHGTAEDREGESMIFTLRQESALNQEKLELLTSLWRDRILLIIGYSGTDFEICPQIKDLRPNRVIWNFLDKKSITNTALRVIEETNGLIVTGDIRDLLSRMYEPVEAQLGKCKSIKPLFRRSFSDFERQFWKARVLTSMTCAEPALFVCDRLLSDVSLHSTKRLAVQEERARALYYLGLHKQSARLFQEAAVSEFQESKNFIELCDLHLAACDSWRSFGSFYRANNSLKSARAIAKFARSRELIAAVRMKELAGLRHRYNLATRVQLSGLSGKIQKRAETLLRKLAKEFVKAGAWVKFYETGRWAELFDLTLDVVKPHGFYESPPPRVAYTRLGDIMGQGITLRDELKRRRIVSSNEFSRTEQLALTMEQFGIWPEVWKLRFLVARKAIRTNSWSNRRLIYYSLKKTLSGLLRCEYTWAMRVGLPLLEVMTSRIDNSKTLTDLDS